MIADGETFCDTIDRQRILEQRESVGLILTGD